MFFCSHFESVSGPSCSQRPESAVARAMHLGRWPWEVHRWQLMLQLMDHWGYRWKDVKGCRKFWKCISILCFLRLFLVQQVLLSKDSKRFENQYDQLSSMSQVFDILDPKLPRWPDGRFAAETTFFWISPGAELSPESGSLYVFSIFGYRWNINLVCECKGCDLSTWIFLWRCMI